MSKRQVWPVEASSYGIIFAILDQAIVRVVGSVRGGRAGVVFESVVSGHFASCCVDCGLSAILSAFMHPKELFLVSHAIRMH